MGKMRGMMRQKAPKAPKVHKHPIDERFICEVLQLPPPPPGENEVFTAITIAEHAVPGCIAFLLFNIEDYRKVTPIYSDVQLAKLADVAMEKGARLLITTKQIKDYPCLLADAEHLLNVYAQLLSAHRKRYNIPTISVTGSRGKTSTTQFIFATLNFHGPTLVSQTGINANAWQYAGSRINDLQKGHKYYVQETQEGPTPGAPGIVSKIIKPDIAVITNVGTSHLEILGSVEGVLASCLSVQDGMSEEGLLILNGDDEMLVQAETRLPLIYFGIGNQNATYNAENIRKSVKGIEFDILYEDKVVPIFIRCLGEHNVYNALAAFAVGKRVGLTDSALARSIAKFRTAGIRQNLVEIKGRNVYLDCFNAAPESMLDALKTILDIPRKANDKGKRIAVLADMSQLGAESKQKHEEIGAYIRDSGLDMLICCGELSADIYHVAKENENIEAILTKDLDALAEALKAKTTLDDIVLIKGSRSMKLEEAVDAAFGTNFAFNYAKTEKILPVQQEDWEAIQEKQKEVLSAKDLMLAEAEKLKALRDSLTGGTP